MSVKDTVHTTLALMTLCAASTASGHVKPSLDVNNRYIKLSPTVDRVRLAYTVYLGEQPGARERKRLDRDHDGVVSDAEANVFRDWVAEGVRDSISIGVDGRRYALNWSQTYIGLGTPTTDAGSFSIDLIAWVCLPPGKEHHIELRDEFRIELPGETEVKVEEGPDVTIVRAGLGEKGASMLDMKWLGGPGPAATEGVHIDLRIDGPRPTSLQPGDVCADPAAGSVVDSGGGGAENKSRPLLWGAGAIGLFLVLAGLYAWRRRS